MNTAAFSGLIGAAAVTFLTSYFGNRPSELSPQSGRRRLFYALGLRAFVNVVVVLLLLATIRVVIRQPEDTSLHVFLTLFTLVAGGYLVLETHFTSIEFDDAAVYVSTIWRKNRKVSWDDFKSIHQRPFFSMHTMETHGSGKVHVSDLMSGSGDLVKLAKWQGRRNEVK